MFLISINQGRLANQLFLFSHLIAHALQNGYRVLNPGFSSYFKYFTLGMDESEQHIAVRCRSPWYSIVQIVLAIAEKTLRRLRIHSFFYNPADGPSLARRRKRTAAFADWSFRDYVSFEKYSSQLRIFFSPIQSLRHNVDDFIKRCRDGIGILIGIHIRKGDYAQWNDGAFFYDDSLYAEKMAQLSDQLVQRHVNFRFLLCSDSDVQRDCFSKFNTVIGIGRPIEDLFSLACCDYLMGPPSTFSLWASFYGQVPLLHISSPDQPIKIDDFKVADG